LYSIKYSFNRPVKLMMIIKEIVESYFAGTMNISFSVGKSYHQMLINLIFCVKILILNHRKISIILCMFSVCSSTV
jgi:hypothetical protein